MGILLEGTGMRKTDKQRIYDAIMILGAICGAHEHCIGCKLHDEEKHMCIVDAPPVSIDIQELLKRL